MAPGVTVFPTIKANTGRRMAPLSGFATLPTGAGHMLKSRFLKKRTLVLAGVSTLFVAAGAGGWAGGIGASLSPVASAAAAEAGHEGSCSDCGGSSHGSGEHETEEGHSGKKGGQKGRGKGGQRDHGGGGHDIGDIIFRGHGRHGSSSSGFGHESTGHSDSLQRGGSAGRGHSAAGGSSRGGSYGNLWVVLRDPATGAPILDENGNVQPILSDGRVVQLTAGGDLPAEYGDQVQTVEFSRLNVSRAPGNVTAQALQRALDTIRGADEITRDAAGRLVAVKDGEAKTIDSPLENLALYADAITNGAFTAQQAAAFLGAAADKTQPISVDTVVYLNTILGLNGAGGTNYVDFTHFSYDRSRVYSGDVTYLVAGADGTYHTVVKPIIEAVFHDQDVTETGVAGFARAADDARAVIRFVHDNGVDTE